MRVDTATYNAYCAKPFFPSCEGNGTSALFFFTGIGVPGLPRTSPGATAVGAAAASLGRVVDIRAACCVRTGVRACIGLAVQFH